MTDNPARTAWAGLTYELLCRDHLYQIRQKLSIAGVLTETSFWQTRVEDEASEPDGAQIDLVIDRRDHVISLCEIKYSMHEFEIDKAYDLKLRNKIEAFRRETGTTKTLGVVVHEDDRTRNGIKNRRGRT